MTPLLQLLLILQWLIWLRLIVHEYMTWRRKAFIFIIHESQASRVLFNSISPEH